jgi:membrane protease YdiL (CAAX protease family)
MKTSISGYTIAGLFLSFFGATLVLNIFNQIVTGHLTNENVIVRELSVFAVAAVLIWIIYSGEKLDISSIGLHGRHWGKSLLLSLILVVLSFGVTIICLFAFKAIGISYGQGGGGRYDNISPWVMTLIMLRAGIVEEICYRGYLMERLEKISGNWLVFFLLPSLVFGLLHYKQGIGGIIIAFALGLLISYVYWKKRDLKANIIAHIVVDFVPNVLLPLIGGGE